MDMTCPWKKHISHLMDHARALSMRNVCILPRDTQTFIVRVERMCQCRKSLLSSIIFNLYRWFEYEEITITNFPRLTLKRYNRAQKYTKQHGGFDFLPCNTLLSAHDNRFFICTFAIASCKRQSLVHSQLVNVLTTRLTRFFISCLTQTIQLPYQSISVGFTVFCT